MECEINEWMNEWMNMQQGNTTQTDSIKPCRPRSEPTQMLKTSLTNKDNAL